MTRLPAAALIILGSSLEITYYILRFNQDGTALWLSAIISVALTLFLAVLTMMRAKPWAVVAAFILAAYSVFATSAGQAFSLSQVLDERSQYTAGQAIAGDAITDYRANISRLDREEADLLASVEGMSLQDRAIWATRGVAPMRERQETIAAERREWQNRIDAERRDLTTHTTVERSEMNIYTFYGRLFGWRPDRVQVALQVALSVFIAMMAPAGIIMLSGPKPEQPPEPEPEPLKKKVSAEYARQAKQWAHISWAGIRTKRRTRLMELSAVKRAAESQEIKCNLFDKLLANAVRGDIIEKDTDGHYIPAVSEEEAVRILCGG